MEFAIFDLDGCLSDDRHRRHLLPAYGSPQKEYAEYHSHCGLDPVAPEGYKYFCKAMRARLTPIFVTARPAEVRPQTVRWLKRHLDLDSPAIFMRPEGNVEASPALKVGLLISRGVAPEKVAFAVDDRDDVLAAYAQWGLEGEKAVRVAVNDPPPGLDPRRAPRSKVKTEAERLADAHEEARVYAQPHEGGEKTAADMLDEMAKTFVERNAVYKSNYALVGRILEVLHGDDAPRPAKDLVGTVDKFNVWHLWELIIVKVTRFANSGLEHPDSIHDIAVYAAMIEAQLSNKEGKK